MQGSPNTSNQPSNLQPASNIFSGLFKPNNQASQSNVEMSQLLWGNYMDSARWQDNLHRKAAHKALNIPDESMINAPHTTVNNGISPLLMLLLLLSTVAFAVLLTATGFVLLRPAAQPAPPAAQVQPSTPALPSEESKERDSGSQAVTTETVTRQEDYELRFFDAATGEWVYIPHISKLPADVAVPPIPTEPPTEPSSEVVPEPPAG